MPRMYIYSLSCGILVYKLVMSIDTLGLRSLKLLVLSINGAQSQLTVSAVFEISLLLFC